MSFPPRPARKSIETRLGLPTAKTDAKTDDRERARRPIAQLVAAVLEPIWYWLDLFGQDDHPSNSKVVATAAILTGLAIVLALGIAMAHRGVNPDEWYVVLCLGVIGGAAGWDVTKMRTKARAATDALRAGAAAEPAADAGAAGPGSP